MPADKVTIDPEFRPGKRSRSGRDRSRYWIGATVIVVAILAASLLLRVSGPASRTAPPHQAIFDTPLQEVVPGFSDTITILAWRNQGVDILRWPASQPAPEQELSLDHADGSNRSLDASGRWLVEIQEQSVLAVRAVDGGSAGSGTLLDDTGGGRVWSAAWHDTRPGRLAWLTCPAGDPAAEVALHTADVTDAGAEATTRPTTGFACGGSGVWLARWGDWGSLLYLNEGSGTTEVLLNAEGTEIARGQLSPDGKWLVGVGPELTTVWTEGPGSPDAAAFVVSPDGLDHRPVPGLAVGERLEIASVSPDGLLLALVPVVDSNFGSMVRIVDAGTGAVVAEIAEPSSWVDRLVWSSDSRFLAYERWPDVPLNWAGVPQRVELAFYDTKTNAGVALSLPGYSAALRSSRPTGEPD